MAKCVCCGAETLLHVSGVPICVECDNESMRRQGPGKPKELKKQQDSEPNTAGDGTR